MIRSVRERGVSALPIDPIEHAHVLTVFFLEEVAARLTELRSANGGWLSTACVDPTVYDDGYELETREQALSRFNGSTVHTMLDEVFFGYAAVWSIAADKTEQQLSDGVTMGPHQIVDRGYLALMKEHGAYRRHPSVSGMAQDGIGTFLKLLFSGAHLFVEASPELLDRLPLNPQQAGLLGSGIRQLTPWLLRLALLPGPLLARHFFRPLGLVSPNARGGVFDWTGHRRVWEARRTDDGVRMGLTSEAVGALTALAKVSPEEWLGSAGGCAAVNARIGGLNLISSEAKHLASTVRSLAGGR
jgi:hypothetical protein